MPLVQSVEVFISVSESSVAAVDPVYIGVITKHYGAREFPLRFQKTGMTFVPGNVYKFGFGSANVDYQPAWDSQGTGSNSLNAYPLEVSDGSQFDQRIYIKKKLSQDSGALVLDDISVTLRTDSGEAFFYRTRYPGREEPSVVNLANENGQIFYLYPV